MSSGAHKRKMHCGRNPVSGELDNKVMEYVKMVRKDGREPLNDQQVQQVARDMGKELGVAGFKASGSWLRRWKGRCDALKDASAETSDNLDVDTSVACERVCEEPVMSNCRTMVSPYQLTILSTADKVDFVCLDECLTEVRERPACPDAESIFDYSTPEHNYSMVLSSKVSSSQLASRGCQTPNLQSNVAELLENVALLRAHEQVALGLTLDEGLEGAFLHDTAHCPERKISTANIDASSGVLNQDTLCHSFLDYTGLENSQDFACPVPSATSMLEEEQLMSVFNHRSFTDPFPFLPTSFICCPSENSHSFSTEDDIGIDDIMEAQLFGSPYKRSRKKGKTKQSRMCTCNDSSCLHTSTYLGCGGKPGLRSYSVSPTTYTEHNRSPPRGSVLGSPSYLTGHGLLASSPPGGLVASRRSQPVFPDEPEIVFHEIQLGSLHTMPAV